MRLVSISSNFLLRLVTASDKFLIYFQSKTVKLNLEKYRKVISLLSGNSVSTLLMSRSGEGLGKLLVVGILVMFQCMSRILRLEPASEPQKFMSSE